MAAATHFVMETPQYEFKDASYSRKNNRRSHHHSNDDMDDGNGSLSYSSAASSINSSAAESTDSSFADIMKVLDGQENTRDVVQYLQQHQAARSSFVSHGSGKHDTASVADSLAYSANAESLAYSTDAESNVRSLATDGESALHGTDLISTVTGYVCCPSMEAAVLEPAAIASYLHFTRLLQSIYITWDGFD